MELSIKQISEGGTFMADFKKIVVERCHYVNAADERVEETEIPVSMARGLASKRWNITIRVWANSIN